MKIRTAGQEDLEKLDSLLGELIQFESEFDVNIDSNAETAGNYAQLLDSEGWRIFVAEEQNQIIGYCCGFVFHGFARKKPIAVLDALYVAEPYRHRGFGRQLAEAFIAWAGKSGDGYVELKVLSGNAPAERLYDTLGFKEVERKLRRPLRSE